MPDAAFNWAPQTDPLLSVEAFAPAPPLSSRGPLHPGSTWAGVQRSGRNSYEVTVKIDTVDLAVGRVNGTLEIKGLTPELESLVTFFEGEIVGEVGGPGFRTAQYGATEVDDLKHWRRFPAFTRNRLEQQLVKPGLHLRNAHGRPYVFMRWKEQFVTSHRVEAIHGASYAGFYYCCLDCDPAPISADSVVHRGISPAPPSAFPPPRPRRTSSYGRNEPGLLSQTRPIPSRAPTADSGPSPTVNIPSPTANPFSTERPAPPRRGSSGFSYAAALRGDAPVDAPMVSSPSPSSSSSSSSSSFSGSLFTPRAQPAAVVPGLPDLPTPKSELDPALAAFTSDLLSSTPVHLPPLWQAIAATPPSTHLPSVASHATTPADDAEWPAPAPIPAAPPARPPRAMRRMSSDVATVLAKAKRGRPGFTRRKSVVQDPPESEFDDRGLRSWTDATISGFYFHHSASPYQELSLRYVPATQGGSAEFSFR